MHLWKNLNFIFYKVTEFNIRLSNRVTDNHELLAGENKSGSPKGPRKVANCKICGLPEKKTAGYSRGLKTLRKYVLSLAKNPEFDRNLNSGSPSQDSLKIRILDPKVTSLAKGTKIKVLKRFVSETIVIVLCRGVGCSV